MLVVSVACIIRKKYFKPKSRAKPVKSVPDNPLHSDDKILKMFGKEEVTNNVYAEIKDNEKEKETPAYVDTNMHMYEEVKDSKLEIDDTVEDSDGYTFLC